MDAVVSRLHGVLADAIRTVHAGRPDQPVSVAEIYQELAPYRNVRASIGVEMNADYEFALLRLLAGEGGFARIEPAEAREALRLEIASPNPNVTLYRKFAGCDVWVDLERAGAAPLAAPIPAPPFTPHPIDPAATERPGNGGGDVPLRPTAARLASPFTYSEIERASAPDAFGGAPDPGYFPQDDPLDSVDFALPAVQGEGAGAESGDLSRDQRHACVECQQMLPPGRTVNFCPHCGSDQRAVVCGGCGEMLERGWRFCPACGASVAQH